MGNYMHKGSAQQASHNPKDHYFPESYSEIFANGNRGLSHHFSLPQTSTFFNFFTALLSCFFTQWCREDRNWDLYLQSGCSAPDAHSCTYEAILNT